MWPILLLLANSQCRFSDDYWKYENNQSCELQRSWNSGDPVRSNSSFVMVGYCDNSEYYSLCGSAQIDHTNQSTGPSDRLILGLFAGFAIALILTIILAITEIFRDKCQGVSVPLEPHSHVNI